MPNSIPDGWMMVCLDSIAELSLGKMLDKAKNKGQLRPYLRNINVRWGSIDISDVFEMKFENDELERFSVNAGDVLICEGGEPGRAAIWDGPDGKIMYQKALHRVRPKAVLQGQYLLACLRWDSLNGNLSQYFTGSTIKHLPSQALGSYTLPLPPINEQRRIVAKLDALLARIRRTREELDEVPRLTQQFRQAALGSLFALSGYPNRQLDALVDAERGITYGIVQTGDHTENGIPTVRCGDIKAFGIEIPKLKKVNPSIEINYRRTRIQGGEVLIAIRGTVGATAVAVDSMHGMNISREVAMIPILKDLLPEFLMYLLASPEISRILGGYIKGVAQSGINIADLKLLKIPVPPIQKQKEIVRRIESLFARADALSAEVKAARERLDMLEQAVLAKAFRGELVPQDPSDEPASVLLERIRAERAAGVGEPPARKRGRAKKE